MDGCTHPAVVDGVCKSCGLCISFDEEYVSSYVFQAPMIPSRMKYAVVNEAKRYDRYIEPMLNIMGVLGYASEVRAILLTKKFKYRANANDKVLSTTYHVLRKHHYPISYSDMLPYTERNDSRLKRLILREFEYNGTSREYLVSVFDRISDFYYSRGLRRRPCVDGFISVAESHRCTNARMLCTAYFIKDEDVAECYERYKLKELASIGLLRSIVRKLTKPLEQRKTQRLRIEGNMKRYFMGRRWRDDK